jgi:hypothetical protein
VLIADISLISPPKKGTESDIPQFVQPKSTAATHPKLVRADQFDSLISRQTLRPKFEIGFG